MNDSNSFFRPAQNVLGGYYVPVRNDLNYFIKYRHLTKDQKELYEQEFDHQVIMDKEFLEWYERIHQTEKGRT